MKQKLTVLACVGLALLLSTGFAFAQNTITVESKNVNRCDTVDVNVTLDNLSDDVDAIGLPLIVSGGNLLGVTAGPALAGHSVVINQSGNQVLVNAVGNCLLAAGPHSILTLTIETSNACSGTIDIALDPNPLVASAGLVLGGCGCCAVPAAFNAGALTLVNQDPICGVNNDENLHFSGSIVDKQLNASDPDGCDGLTYSPVSGPGSITADGKFSWDPDCADLGTHTVTFRATDDCTDFVECTFDVEVTHNGPVCLAVADQTVHWADHLTAALPATDDGCPDPLTWTLVDDGGLLGALSVTGGSLEYDGNCLDIPGPHTVVYDVDDGDMTCQGSVDVYVTNTAPTIVCPTPLDPSHLCNHQIVGGGDGIFNLGDLVEGASVGNDADGDPVTYSVISVEVDGNPYVPVNAPAIGPAGYFTWQSTGSDAVGTYEFCLEIDDGCYQNICCFSVDLELNMYMAIYDETGTIDTIPAFPGQQVCVYLNIFPDIPLGGIDVLLCYDMTGLQFLPPATSMVDLADWEYFTFRTSVDGNCGSSACPTGYIRIVAIADMDNGPTVHPDDDSFGLEGGVVELCFQVTSDWNFLGMCLPINFCTLTCGDNALASKDGNTLYLPLGSDPECFESPKYTAIEEIELCGGAICVREPEDARGDINIDGIANTVADAVLFSRYFIEGDVWDPTYELIQIQATDVNNDGVVLTVADLVYLIRIITGDEQPFADDNGNPKVSPYAGQADAIVKVSNGNVSVTTNSAVDLGGALFVFRYSGMGVGEAVASDAAANMVVKSRANRGELRVLVAPQIRTDSDLGTIEAGTHEVVTIPTSGEGTIDLVEVQLSDARGALLASNLSRISPPKSYALMQNYPNPFNAGTVIRFDLSQDSEWELQVYNITGQVVRTFSGHDEASTVSVTWDGNDRNGSQAASGVYFYRVNAGDFTATKKMTLVK